jgi:hypothetical protein
MSGLWADPGVPHRGWICVNVCDLEIAEGVCEMCGKENIRYVHYMEHPQFENRLGVGCICAEKMSDDYVNPRLRECELRNRAARRTKWLKKKWRCNDKGSYILKIKDYHITVFQSKYTTNNGEWLYYIGSKCSLISWPSASEAMLGAFDAYEKIINEQ